MSFHIIQALLHTMLSTIFFFFTIKNFLKESKRAVSSLPNKCFCCLSKTIIFYVTLDIEKFVDIKVFQHLLFIIDILTEKNKVLTLKAVFSFLSTFVCFRFTIYSHFCSKVAKKDKNDQISYSRKFSEDFTENASSIKLFLSFFY